KHASEHLKERPVLLLFLPTANYLIDVVNPSLSVYYSVDDYSEVPFVDSNYILNEELKTVERTDIVIVVSRNRADYFRQKGVRNVYYLNNVARFALFNKALTE